MDEYTQRMSCLRAALESFQNRDASKYFCVATNIVDMSNFYVVPVDCYNNCNLLECPGNPHQTIPLNTLIIYQSPTLRRFVRGKVQEMEGDLNTVLAIDYGIIDVSVKSDVIFDLGNEEARSIPALAQLCQLDNCYPLDGGSFSDENIESFKKLMGKPQELLGITVTGKVDSKMSVLVVSSDSNPHCVSSVMSYCNQTAFFGYMKLP